MATQCGRCGKIQLGRDETEGAAVYDVLIYCDLCWSRGGRHHRDTLTGKVFAVVEAGQSPRLATSRTIEELKLNPVDFTITYKPGALAREDESYILLVLPAARPGKQPVTRRKPPRGLLYYPRVVTLEPVLVHCPCCNAIAAALESCERCGRKCCSSCLSGNPSWCPDCE